MTTVYLYERNIDKIHPVVINPTAPLKASKNLLRTNLKVFWAGIKSILIFAFSSNINLNILDCDWYFNDVKIEDNVTLSNVAPYATIICKEKLKPEGHGKMNITVTVSLEYF